VYRDGVIAIYCVVQEIPLKKPNKDGERKEIIIDMFTFDFGSNQRRTKYAWHYSEERFERPIKKAFKISVHESKRINGVVTKQQFTVTTVDYYHFADGWFELFDYDKKINAIAGKLNVDAEKVYDCVYARLAPLERTIQAEYQETEEYKVREKHQAIIEAYNKAKTGFAETYGCDAGEYDYCYDVFGQLRNRDYLDKVMDDYAQRSSYQNNKGSNYSDSNYWYGNKGNVTSFTESDKVILKKLYRTLSKEYHPDNPSGDGAVMQMVNRLKDLWGI